MAVPHFSVSIVTRGSGGSALLSAAYRHCAKMDYEREARTIDYTRKPGLLHEEFAVPVDAPEWLRVTIANRSVSGASEAFWNRVEGFERRSDAQLAKDVTIALPAELSAGQNIELVRDFVARYITAQGMVADWVYHDLPGNPHVHMMTSLRPLTESGFGPKKVTVAGSDGNPQRNDSGKLVYALWAGGRDDFNAYRDGWFDCQNRHLALAGLDIRIDGRSFKKQGIELTPTIHLGVGTKAIERKATQAKEKNVLERVALQEELRAENARRIQRNPEIVLDLITRERSVFDSRDIAKVLYRNIDDATLFLDLMARIRHSPRVVRLDRERLDLVTGVRVPEKYSTRELIRLEAEMTRRAIWLSQRGSHRVVGTLIARIFSIHERLTDEQKIAIEHVTGAGRIAAVVGRAGAGKTTMMRAAREVWEAAGYRVVGGALAGKAAEGLEKEAGISSRTLSSWELCWSKGHNQLDKNSVFVLDEAGMVSSRQMAVFVEAVVKAGAKIVLIGDPEQLQPIEAGAAFRAIADRIGYAELETIYRQSEQWMRDASLDLARGTIGKAISVYSTKGKILGSMYKAEAVANLISDWSRDHDLAKTSLILAHLRRDVRMLNERARATLLERGIIDDGYNFITIDGPRKFAAGDQIVFLRNEGSLGVKNGMLAKVVKSSPGRIVARIGEGAHVRLVAVEQQFYNDIDHGYATTIHKSQGSTVDRVKVLASLSLDRHLTYVAMTRHREDLAVYFGRRSFAKAGGLISVLSRSNAKETTLDYADGRFYAEALRFADARGLHLVNVARTIARDKLRWTMRQTSKVLELGTRLSMIAVRLGLRMGHETAFQSASPREAEPMVSGMTTFPTSIAQAVEDRLAASPELKKDWQRISERFHHIYADAKSAFNAVDVDIMFVDKAAAETKLAQLAERPESFGSLRGKTGVFAGNVDVRARDIAMINASALAYDLEKFISNRSKFARRYEAEEQSLRDKLAIDIPALSASSRQVLERVRDAIDRNELPAGLEYALADKMVKAELDGFAKAVNERFGERTFLSVAAKSQDGEVFKTLSAQMPPAPRNELRAAWDTIRTVQRLAAYERTAATSKQMERLRKSESRGLSLK